jgi:peptide/nickel transport system permease protein
MLQYLIKRLLLFLPTLLVVSLLAFGLSRCTPGDPIQCYLPDSIDGKFSMNPAQYERAYAREAKKLGWDKPAFYFRIGPKAYPDTLYRILIRSRRENLEKLIAQYGNWSKVQAYSQQLNQTHIKISELPDSLNSDALIKIRNLPGLIQLRYEDQAITSLLDTLQYYTVRDPQIEHRIGESVQQLIRHYEELKTQTTRHLLYIPHFHWYGTDNQYHDWLSNFISGDLGRSCKDGRPIFDKITDHLKWTLIINGLAILIAYLLSIPIGVYSAFYRDSRFDRITTIVLFLLYSLPSFWIATMLVIFLTNPTYQMNWFPATGLGQLGSTASLWDRFWETAWHITLPVFSLAYGALAFISRQMRASVLEVIGADYIRTARAKGLPKNKVIWKHAFRNALFPLITLFASIFPSLIAGSVVIEKIFNIPGMGLLLINSINSKDWQVVYAILMMAAVVTILGILIADVLYAMVDPRVKFGKSSK